MSDYYVFSTLTDSVAYTIWKKTASDLPLIEKQVLIKGGSNLPDKHMVTPMGVMTGVSGEEMAALLENEIFKLHKDNGFITVREKAANPEAVATAELKARDLAAPLTPNDFPEAQEDTALKVSTGRKAK